MIWVIRDWPTAILVVRVETLFATSALDAHRVTVVRAAFCRVARVLAAHVTVVDGARGETSRAAACPAAASGLLELQPEKHNLSKMALRFPGVLTQSRWLSNIPILSTRRRPSRKFGRL